MWNTNLQLTYVDRGCQGSRIWFLTEKYFNMYTLTIYKRNTFLKACKWQGIKTVF